MDSIKFHPEARLEAVESSKWYESKGAHLRDAFEDELREAVEQVVRYPHRWAKYLHGARYYRLERFPYVLVYIERAGE